MKQQTEPTTQTLCAEALERLSIIPSKSTQARIDEFACSLDRRLPCLDDLDRLELQNAAIEYTVNWATAELLETACGDTGPVVILTGKDESRSCRTNSALTKAATARARMRQILKGIKALLKTASAAQAKADDEKPAQSAPESDDQSGKSAGSPTEVPALEEPPHENPAPEPVAGAPADTPDETSADTVPEDVAPPMNRAQRRAQARLEARQRRKAAKRLRREKARRYNVPSASVLAPV